MVAGICPRKLFAYIRIRFNSREALEYTRSLLGIDEYGLMHEDDSRLPLGEEKNDARCVRAAILDQIRFSGKEIRLLSA